MLTRDTEIAALSGLRGFAAVWVLVYHVWIEAVPRRLVLELGPLSLDFTPFASIGWAGVQIFFVLSGFLLAQPFLRAHSGAGPLPQPGAFLVRRVGRVFPAYLVQLAALLAVAAFLTAAVPPLAGEPKWTIAHLLMFFVPEPLGVVPMNLVWWTLPIEFSFYLALPFLAAALAKAGVLRFFAAALLVMVAWRWWVAGSASVAIQNARVYYAYQLPGSLDSFAIGMLGAALAVRRDAGSRFVAWATRPSSIRPGLLAAAAAGLLYWMHFGYRGYWTRSPIFFAWTPLFSLVVVSVILGALRCEGPLARLLGSSPMRALGTVSYGVYLWHLPILGWIAHLATLQALDGYRFPLLLALTLAATIVVATLSWFAVERPAIAFVRRFARQPRPAAAWSVR